MKLMRGSIESTVDDGDPTVRIRVLYPIVRHCDLPAYIRSTIVACRHNSLAYLETIRFSSPHSVVLHDESLDSSPCSFFGLPPFRPSSICVRLAVGITGETKDMYRGEDCPC
jgi:hypothetical protein